MVKFKVKIQRDNRDPEKQGWTYIIISKTIAEKLNPNDRRGFRVKGKLDDFAISQTSLLPVKEGRYLLPINARLRKGTGKGEGDTLTVQLEVDKKEPKLSQDLLVCLADEPKAEAFFNKLTKSHQRYFSNWVESAKTDSTRTKRIMLTLDALAKGKDFGQMIRDEKASR